MPKDTSLVRATTCSLEQANVSNTWEQIKTRDKTLFLAQARAYAWQKEAMSSRDWRKRLQLFMEDPRSSRASLSFFVLICLLICTQVFALAMRTGTFDLTCDASCNNTLNVIDIVLSCVFTLELILRTLPKQRLSDFLSFFWIVDFVSVIPFYIQLICDLAGIKDATTAEALELLRVLRIVRLLKVSQMNPDTAVLQEALARSWRALLVPAMFLFIGAILFGALDYYLERFELRGAQGFKQSEDDMWEGTDAFPDFGTAVWFMIVTFSTVGYGDTYPESHTARAITVFAIMCGLIFTSMPIAIVGNNFTHAWEDREKMTVVVLLQKHLIDQNLGVDGIASMFRKADSDGDGSVNYLEFRRILLRLGLNLKPSDSRDLFSAFDETGTGDINFFEFCHLVFPELPVEELHAYRGFSTCATDEVGRSATAPLYERTSMRDMLNSQARDFSAALAGVSETSAEAAAPEASFRGASFEQRRANFEVELEHSFDDHVPKHHAAAHHTASHHITPYRIMIHHIISHHVTPYHATSQHATSHHITSHHIT